ncbi:MAG: hypothetical protein RIS80_1103, partial [Actinomycetota bacterium]
MADSSFDIVSKVDKMEADNALHQAQKEIEQFFNVNQPKVQYMFINTAIEYTKDHISSPVKNFADDSVFFPIDLKRQSQANLYMRKADLGLGKSWYAAGMSEYNFIKVEDVREYYEPWSMATAKPDDMR